jgi:hypothetical protein
LYLNFNIADLYCNSKKILHNSRDKIYRIDVKEGIKERKAMRIKNLKTRVLIFTFFLENEKI